MSTIKEDPHGSENVPKCSEEIKPTDEVTKEVSNNVTQGPSAEVTVSEMREEPEEGILASIKGMVCDKGRSEDRKYFEI
jgi:hypothetical protein